MKFFAMFVSVIVLALTVLLYFILKPSDPVHIEACGFGQERKALSEKYSNRDLTLDELNQMEKEADELFEREMKAIRENKCVKEYEYSG